MPKQLEPIYVEHLKKSIHPKNISENILMKMIVEFAEDHGWYWFHEYDSRKRNIASKIPNGFPDLILVHNDTIVFAELKSQGKRNNLSDDQKRWAKRLGWLSTSVHWFVWIPSDWGQIQSILGAIDNVYIEQHLLHLGESPAKDLLSDMLGEPNIARVSVTN